jgi:hypothetical protein
VIAADTPSLRGSEQRADGTDCSVVRRYEEGDERELVRFLGGPFAHGAGVEHWRWKLCHAAVETTNVWLATANGKAVFHYGGIPVRFALDGPVVTAMVSVDALTAPEFRRRGLLTQGATRAFADWQAHGVAFTLGLPNEQWGSRTAAVGWQRLFPLQWLVLPLRLEVFAARRFGLPWLRHARVLSRAWDAWLGGRLRQDPRLEFRDVARAGDGFDRLWQRCATDAMFSAVRDSAWVHWRFLSSPARKYDVVLACRDGEPVGYRAMHVARSAEKTSAFLAELVAPNNDEAARDSLLAGAIARAHEAGADILAALAVPGTALYALLSRAGFFRGPAFGVHIVPFAAGLPMDRLRRPENWRLSGAEFDVV